MTIPYLSSLGSKLTLVHLPSQLVQMARAQGWPYQASKELLRRIASHNSKLGFKWNGATKKYTNKKDS